MKQGEKTKQLILSTANDLFYQQGYSKTSINDIVKLTGIGKGNVTYHFKSKRDILHGVVDIRNINITKKLNSWDDEISSVTGRLERFCDILAIEQESLIKFGCPMGTLIGELSKSELPLYEISLPMLNNFRVWLKKQFKLLGYPNKKADEYALELLGRTQGISAGTHMLKDTDFLNREIKKLKHYIHTITKK